MVRMIRMGKILKYLVISIGLGLGAVATGMASMATAEAVEPGQEQVSVLQLMVGHGPVPAAAVEQPRRWEEFADLVGDWAWPMPQARQWPMDISGQPIVETRRRDEMWHEMERWQTVASLRRMYRRTTAQLQELNPDLDLGELKEGQRVLVWRRDDEHFSESRGGPSAGRVIYSEPMPASDDYILLYPHRSFGTHYAVSETVRVLDEYYREFRDADPLIVGDLSFRTGRRINPHSSHQSGRDVDITLPRQAPPPNYDRFHHVRRDNLDAQRALWLLTNLIDGGYVRYVFLDWYHQRTLWQLAKDQGAPQEWLDEVFQYPRRGGQGIVRHASGHATHFHIRFRCQETDRWCR